MNKSITKSQIKNIGKRLRNASAQDSLEDKDLDYLNKWRSHHGPSLKYYAKLLKEEAISLDLNEEQFTVTQRLKRIHSIIIKLKRYPLMQLSMMDDIPGARIVLPDIMNVYELVDALKERKSKHEMLKLNNYISRPKDDGYRSIHLVYKIEKQPDILLEIQLRSALQHIWATGVEVFGTLEETSFKTGEGAKEWKQFFKLLSSRFAIKEGATVIKEHEIYSHTKINGLLIKKIKELNVIEQLNAYTSIYSSNWRNERPKGRSGKYALLTLNTVDNSTKVSIYAENKFNKALEDYSKVEKVHHSSEKINVVLVNLDNIDKLERAYPNYFMDTKTLSNYLSQIVLNKF